MSISLGKLVSAIGASLSDEAVADTIIKRVAPVQEAGPGEISFISNPKYIKHLSETHATAVIMSAELAEQSPVTAIIADNPYVAYARAAAQLNPPLKQPAGIHGTAVVVDSADIASTAVISANVVIDAGASIADGCSIGAGSYIGAGVSVGKDSILNANVSVYHGCQIGERAIIHSNAVIGSDGFGFANDSGRWVKVPQTGIVKIGDDVEIGASTTIDRGAIDATIIGNGVKLDNQIQIAHNVKIGDHTAIAGCSGVAGSTTIGSHCTIAGMCTIVGHIELTDNVHITAMSLITKSINKPGSYSSGTPFEDTASWRKNSVRFRQLDKLAKQLSQLLKKTK